MGLKHRASNMDITAFKRISRIPTVQWQSNTNSMGLFNGNFSFSSFRCVCLCVFLLFILLFNHFICESKFFCFHTHIRFNINWWPFLSSLLGFIRLFYSLLYLLPLSFNVFPCHSYQIGEQSPKKTTFILLIFIRYSCVHTSWFSFVLKEEKKLK